MNRAGPRLTRRSLPMALLRAREAVMTRFRPLLAKHGVTEQQWRVVRILGEAGPLDATELASRAAILTPSLTRIIRDLGERKLISKRRNPGDSRRLVLDVTAKARQMIIEMLPDITAAYEALETAFGAERLDALLDTLEALDATVPSTTGPPSSR